MTSTFKTVIADLNGIGKIQSPSSSGISQVPSPVPFSTSEVSVLHSMLKGNLSNCNASSFPALQMTPQIHSGDHSEMRELPYFCQGESLDSTTALHQRIQKLQNELEEINGRLQKEKSNLTEDEIKLETSQKVEESFAEHKPNNIIAPCPAMGMPFDHNYKTANFSISDKTGHGDELVCSYFDCQKVGIKFRYCGFCKLPVSKRNFSKFHSHSDEVKGKVQSDQKQQSFALNSKPLSIDGTPLCAEISRGFNGPVNKKREHSQMTHKTLDDCKRSSISLEIRKSRDGYSPPNFDLGDDSHCHWVQLLHERPSTNNKRKMSI